MARKPGRYDIEIIQGAYNAWTLACQDDAGALIDTAGWTGSMEVRATVDSAAALVTLTTANGRIATGIQGTAPNQYNVLVTILEGDTTALANFGLGVYDVELVDTFGHVIRVIEGTAVLSPEVTR